LGFLELEHDPEILPPLLDAAASWLGAHGRDRMVGPMDFTVNDESGVLIDGFEREPLIRQPWQPPYYQRLCEQAGLAKEVDTFMWELEIADRSKVLPIVFKLAEDLAPRHGITIRRMTRRSLRDDLDRFAEVYNEAWSENWGFAPYEKADLDAMAQEFQLVFDSNWMMVAETREGETAAVALTFPDINQVLKRMNGRLLPLGWWHFLRKGAIVDRVRVGFLGVKPAYQHTGVAAALYVEHFDTAGRRPQKRGEMGWILETNRNMNRAMEAMGGRIVKRYRLYARDLAGGG
jgi:GNAT superfamily N-acetyltransferase